MLLVAGNTFLHYLLHTIDLRSEDPWENKTIYMRYVDIVIGESLRPSPITLASLFTGVCAIVCRVLQANTVRQLHDVYDVDPLYSPSHRTTDFHHCQVSIYYEYTHSDEQLSQELIDFNFSPPETSRRVFMMSCPRTKPSET